MPPEDRFTEEEEELVQNDDTVIGRALGWSFIIFAILGFGICITIFILKRPPPVTEKKVTALATPAPRERKALELPSVKFTDVTEAAGIRFTHYNGARGEKLLPETMGAGCAIFDCDGDGAQDLLFINGNDWPWPPASGAGVN